MYTTSWLSTKSVRDVVAKEAFHLDEDLISENPDLTFYLATPDGSLRVRRSGQGSSYESRILATGFYHDTKIYGPNSSNSEIKYSKDVYNEVFWGDDD